MANMLWTETEITRLRELALTDLSLREIGLQLRRSKYSVTRKVRDLNLRPAGHRKVVRKHSTSQDSHEKQERAGKTTLPTLPSLTSNEQE